MTVLRENVIYCDNPECAASLSLPLNPEQSRGWVFRKRGGETEHYCPLCARHSFGGRQRTSRPQPAPSGARSPATAPGLVR